MTTARKLLTADDLLAMPDDGKRYELVQGELIEMPPPSITHAVVTGRLGYRITHFIEERNLPFIYGPEAGIYIEQEPDTIRAADYALINRQRITEPLPERGYAAGVIPDLVVEVISPDYPRSAVDAKIQMWLAAGVRIVLAIYIASREVAAHHNDGTTQRFGAGDTLTCEPVLPGFACPVDDIFAY